MRQIYKALLLMSYVSSEFITAAADGKITLAEMLKIIEGIATHLGLQVDIDLNGDAPVLNHSMTVNRLPHPDPLQDRFDFGDNS